METCIHSRTFEREPLEAFLASLDARNYSVKSVGSYQNALERCLEYLEGQEVCRVQDVTSNHLENYRLNLIDRGVSNATLYQYLWCVRFFYGFLEATHRIFINPAHGLVLPKYRRKIQQVPSVAQVMQLLDQPNLSKATGIRDKAFLETVYSCGLRREEAVNLDLSDLDLTEGVVRVCGKGSKERVLPIGDTAVHWIGIYLDDARPNLLKGEEQALWVTCKGSRLSYSRIDKMIQGYATSAGLTMKLSTHSLRRACATHMLSNGAHPLELQQLLGHSELKTLSQYLKVSITEMKAMHERSRPGQ